MKRLVWTMLSVFVVAAVLPTVYAVAAPKYTIKEAMKLHKEKLHEKFQKGTATKEETATLLEAYESMAMQKPPKGDEAEWKKKCDALVKAVKDGDKDAFKTAVGCGGCHSGFKP